MEQGALLSSFTLLFLAEMGDKTQLMAMTLANRYRAAPVIVGAFLAFLVLNLMAVLIGGGVAHLVPREYVLIAAGALFLLFGFYCWRDSEEDAAEAVVSDHRRAWMVVFGLMFVAELGDKTQLAMVALAAESGAVWSVFLGGTLALWTVSLLGILAGNTLLRRLPGHWVQRGAALLFVLFGVLALVQAARLLIGEPGGQG